jgi:NAD(P)-dependent dehydrogenase (short-subunit alcohol dehydrogenase family)
VKTFESVSLARREPYRKLFGAYAEPKLALSLWTEAAAASFSAQGVSIVSACPGANKTPLTAGAGMPWLLKILASVMFKPPGVGAGKLHDVAMDGSRFPTGA